MAEWKNYDANFKLLLIIFELFSALMMFLSLKYISIRISLNHKRYFFFSAGTCVIFWFSSYWFFLSLACINKTCWILRFKLRGIRFAYVRNFGIVAIHHFFQTSVDYSSFFILFPKKEQTTCQTRVSLRFSFVSFYPWSRLIYLSFSSRWW